MAELWPPIILPRTVDFAPMPMANYGPPATSGLQQVGATDAGFWAATLSEIPLRTADQIREWRYLTTVAQGGLRDIVVGPFDCRQAPRPFAHRGVEATDIPWSDGSSWGDGSLWSQSLIRTTLHANVARRATALAIDIEIAGPIRRGMYFSIADRLYMVASIPVIEVAGGDYGAGQRLSFAVWPPLRQAASAGAKVEFGKPRATMRLPKGQQGRAAIKAGRSADVSIDLVEAWDGF